ncbi:MAG: hypothetical protein K8H84_12985 [Sulfuricella denitrificans]|nr:hypothetical protein [Sulfuricella denitrificans]
MLFTTLALFGLVLVLNLLVDTYDVLGTGMLKYPLQPNQYYLKIQHLEKHRERYDAYLMGSSRIGTTSPAMVQRYLPEGRFYNLSVPGGTSLDNLQLLKYLLSGGYRPKFLYLQLDTDIGFTQFLHDRKSYQFRHHPDMEGQNKFLYWLDFATAINAHAMFRKLRGNLEPRMPDGFVSLDLESGAWALPSRNARIKADQEKYIEDEPTFHSVNSRFMKNLKGRENLDAIRKLRDICARRQIRLIVFTTPHHRNIMDSLDEKDYLDWLRDLSAITPFWDFSGYNSITLDDHNYLESSHYLPHVGELIAARIFNDPGIQVPADFGVWVDASSVERHLSELRQQIRSRTAKPAISARPHRADSNTPQIPR